MKNFYSFFAFLLMLIIHQNAKAQLFGQDVKVTPGDSLNQDEVKIDVAFNGWIYALHNTQDINGGGLTLRRSIDSGATWVTIERYHVANLQYKQFDLVVAGADTNTLRVFVAAVNYDVATGTYSLFVDKYNGNGTFSDNVLYNGPSFQKIYDVAIATDYKFPAVGASPYSIGLVYSRYTSAQDSIIYYCSTDGGNTFLPSQKVATTGYYFRNVDIAYARSSSGSNGRYVFAWERMNTSTSVVGNIYTARNTSTVDGATSTPVNLDSLSNTMIGVCRNPRISAMQGTIDSDSGGVTAIVVVDRFYGPDYDVLGFVNKRAHFTDFWYRFDLNNTGNSDMFGAVTYDPTNNNFVATYLDSSNQKLVLTYNNYNMSAPSSWNTLSTNYANHPDELTTPAPSIAINPVNAKAALAWVLKENGKNTAYFDAEYSTIGPITSTVNKTICQGDSVLFNGTYYKAAVSGLAGDTVPAFNGVDSSAVFNLVVNPLPVPVISVNANTLSTTAFSTYQWQLANVDIAGATTQSYVAQASGSYNVVVSDVNGCVGSSAPVNLTVISVDEAAGELNLKVYPNPVVNDLHFDLGNMASANITLTDLQGRELISREVQNHQVLHVGELTAGVYLLNVSNGTQSGTLRIQKQ